MAIFHCCVKTGGRASGQSAIAAAAYRSGEKLTCEETGKTSYYSNKKGIEDSGIILCKNAPEKYKDRSTLWNAVHKIESASNARLWREIEIALPKGFTAKSRRAMVEEYCRGLVAQGMCADWAIHNKGDGNPHAHIMLTTRSITPEGEWAAKSKKVYILDDNGERIYTKTDAQGRKQYKSRKEDYNNWNAAERVEEWREAWANICNKYLTPEKRIDYRSYERQGINQIPTIHLGHVAAALERRGIRTNRGDINREITQSNAQINVLSASIDTTLKEISEIKENKLKSDVLTVSIRIPNEPMIDSHSIPKTQKSSDIKSTVDTVLITKAQKINDNLLPFFVKHFPEINSKLIEQGCVFATSQGRVLTIKNNELYTISIELYEKALEQIRENEPRLNSQTNKSDVLTVSKSPGLMIERSSSASPSPELMVNRHSSTMPPPRPSELIPETVPELPKPAKHKLSPVLKAEQQPTTSVPKLISPSMQGKKILAEMRQFFDNTQSKILTLSNQRIYNPFKIKSRNKEISELIKICLNFIIGKYEELLAIPKFTSNRRALPEKPYNVDMDYIDKVIKTCDTMIGIVEHHDNMYGWNNQSLSTDEINVKIDEIQAQKELERNKDRPRRKSKGWDISD